MKSIEFIKIGFKNELSSVERDFIKQIENGRKKSRKRMKKPNKSFAETYPYLYLLDKQLEVDNNGF